MEYHDLTQGEDGLPQPPGATPEVHAPVPMSDPKPSEGNDDLKRAIADLTSSIERLAERLEQPERESPRPDLDRPEIPGDAERAVVEPPREAAGRDGSNEILTELRAIRQSQDRTNDILFELLTVASLNSGGGGNNVAVFG